MCKPWRAFESLRISAGVKPSRPGQEEAITWCTSSEKYLAQPSQQREVTQSPWMSMMGGLAVAVAVPLVPFVVGVGGAAVSVPLVGGETGATLPVSVGGGTSIAGGAVAAGAFSTSWEGVSICT